jgi:hypothetical protein
VTDGDLVWDGGWLTRPCPHTTLVGLSFHLPRARTRSSLHRDHRMVWS